ncbi:MAG: RDD family protein [Alphaproteobacteria bacterium]
MAERNLASFELRTDGDPASMPDPLAHPDCYHGIAWKRVLAYLVDVVLIALIMGAAALVFVVAGVLTLGVLNPLLVTVFALIPLCYHVFLIGGPQSATMGMRLFGLQVRSLTIDHPDYIQALVQTVIFYLSVGLTTWLILIVALFNPRRRTLHDYVAGTVVVNRAPAEAASPGAAERAA